MFCQIGPYKLELLNAPTDWDFTEDERWVTGDRIGQSPASQHTGRGLFRINQSFRFCKLWNPSPENTFISFLDLKRQGKPVAYIKGNGINWGLVKILSVNFSITESRNGEPWMCEGSMVIEEYKK